MKIFSVFVISLVVVFSVLMLTNFVPIVKFIVESLAFQPPNFPYSKDDVTIIPTKSGHKIPIYFKKSKNINSDRTITLIYGGGNAMNLGMQKQFVDFMHSHIPNINVVAYEYLGYSDLSSNSHRPTELRTYDSLDAAIDFAKKEFHNNMNEIILYGQSIGSGPTIDVACKKKIGGVILLSPFESVLRVVFNGDGYIYPLIKSGDIFMNIDKIQNVTAPVLIFHGNNDNIVHVSHSKKLWKMVDDKYKYKVHYVDKANHNNVPFVMGYEKFFNIISQYVEYVTLVLFTM